MDQSAIARAEISWRNPSNHNPVIDGKLNAGGAELTFVNETWKKVKLPKELEARFLGDYNIFDPLGSFEEVKNPKDNPIKEIVKKYRIS